MQAKAATLMADQVIFDLEDATAPDEKPAARGVVVESLRTLDYGSRTLSLRINGVDTPWCYRDVIEVVEAVGDRLATLILPKAESAADVRFLDRLLSQVELARGLAPGRIGIEVQIESAAGLQHTDKIAAASARLEALIFGPGDLSASLGLGHLSIGTLESAYSGDIWHYAQMRLLVAARANGLLAIDGPYAAFNDLEGLEATSRRSAALGYDGRWVIHPSQIEPVNAVYTPDAAAVARAQALLDAYEESRRAGRGAVRFEGEMIDEANRKMAEAIVRRARRFVE
jgi:citrate lyase subunit beta/citryl-CoA lyase